MSNNVFSVPETDVCLYLLGQTRVVGRSSGGLEDLHIQPKPLQLLAYLALKCEDPYRREVLQAWFWPDKPASSAANNLRQALWHLRQALPPDTLHLAGDTVQWNPELPPWVDVLAFEEALDSGKLDVALDLYGGPLLPDVYDEWAELERERLHIRYLAALELRSRHHYEGQRWEAALADAETLLADDPLNETATRLSMACHWALGRREAARRCYELYQKRLRQELAADPTPETTDLCQRILRGEPHPDLASSETDASTAAQTAHLSLLESLGAFRQGLDLATAWASEARQSVRAAALRWVGRFHLRLGQLAEAHAALASARPLADTPDLQAGILTDLATVETGRGEYQAAEAHYRAALQLTPLHPATQQRLLSALGGLQGRMGRGDDARRNLEEAVAMARDRGDPAPLAIASGNLGILLLGQGEPEAAEAAFDEGLEAARQADAHWLTAHISGHLGLLAQDRDDLELAARLYRRARFLAETIGDVRGALLWTLNLGVVRYEQGRYAEALPLLVQGQEQALAQEVRTLEAGAAIFLGACQIDLGQSDDGLASIERGLALAQEIGDQERILIGLLHRGRALAALGRSEEARVALQEGLRHTEVTGLRRLQTLLRSELENLSPPS